MTYSMHVGGLALVACAFIPHWLPFTASYILWSLANSVTGPVFVLIVGESVAPEKRGRAFGLIEATIGVSLVVGPLAGAELLPYVGAKGLLLISGLLVFVAATGRLFLLRETRPETTGSTPFAFQQVFRGRMGLVLAAVVLWNVILVMTFWGPFPALHAADAMGLSKATINLIAGVASLGSALMGLVAGRLVSRFGPSRMLPVGALGLGLAVVVWALTRSMVTIVTGYVAMSIFMMLAMVSADTFRVSSVEESVRGSALGAIGMVTGLSTSVALAVAGYLRDLWPMAPFWIALASAGGIALAVAALRRRDAAAGSGARAGHEAVRAGVVPARDGAPASPSPTSSAP